MPCCYLLGSFLENGVNHGLETSWRDAERFGRLGDVEVALDRRQVGEALNFSLEMAQLFFLGSLDDVVLAHRELLTTRNGRLNLFPLCRFAYRPLQFQFLDLRHFWGRLEFGWRRRLIEILRAGSPLGLRLLDAISPLINLPSP